MLALLFLAPFAVAQTAAFPSECLTPCMKFSDQFTKCAPNMSNETGYYKCLEPLCPGGDMYNDAQACIKCVGNGQGMDAWSGVEAACKYIGKGSSGSSASSDTNSTASTADVKGSAATPTGAKSAGGAVRAPVYALVGIAGAAILDSLI
ncbi:hypothetical protein CspHIS471_0107900 [Cutaneotrichosporon sp. HIS471]|nr:hypothetical protein CspHIS471_0107900 [Cutaneotrichosporon sp. HIS471]